MAKRPSEDPRVTDLKRYKKAREQARRKPPPRPPSHGMIGSHPKARLILAIVAILALALVVGPKLL